MTITLEWRTATGDYCYVSITPTTAATSNAGEATGGGSLTLYKTIGAIVTVPGDAATARLYLNKGPSMGTGADKSSYMFVTQCYVGVAQPNQTVFSNWSPSIPSIRGLGFTGDLDSNKNPSYITQTKITGTSIESCTITGNTVTGGVIQTGTTGAHIIINENSSNTLRAYASDSITKVVEIGAPSDSGVLDINGVGSYAINADSQSGYAPAILGNNTHASTGVGVVGVGE